MAIPDGDLPPQTMTIPPPTPPRTNVRGLRDHWRNDLIAGFSVALVAIPLALGIATAAGAPAISGLISVFVAGLLTTFLRGSHVAINGPGNSLIVLVALAFSTFGGSGGFRHVLGAIVVAGGLQIVFGLLRLGRLGDLIPGAVIQGLLASIGLIIVGKQLHVLVGRHASATNALDVFRELPTSVSMMHPFVAAIGVLSFAILVIHPLLNSKWIHFVPAPLWVVSLAVPLVWGLNHLQPQIIEALGRGFPIEEELLVSIPERLTSSMVRPDFSRIREPGFWGVVMTIALVSSIENIVSVKAVDRIDPFGRTSRLDRDLVAMGLSTAVAGMLGGLPVLTVVARSSVNLNHGAKTGWSNFFQGVITLLLILLASPVIRQIPDAALAAVLVYTGAKLAGPHVVEEAIRRGPEHLLVLALTLAATLNWGLLPGLAVGLATEFTCHLVILGMPARESLHRLRRSSVETIHEEGGPYLLRVQGIANFLTLRRLRRALETLSNAHHVIVDFAPATLADNAVLEYVNEFGRKYVNAHRGARFDVIGLERHRALADHPDALHVMERPLRERRLTQRQQSILEMAESRGWTFDRARDWRPLHLSEFQFFRQHPIEYRDTVVQGEHTINGEPVKWTLSDVTFDEGIVLPEVYHTTTLVISLPFDVPSLILEKEEVLDRVLAFAGFQDIDFEHFTRFSRRFVLKGPDEESIRRMMSPVVLDFFEKEEEVYHLESNGRELVVFKFFRLSSPHEIEQMLGFSRRLLELLAEERR